VQAKSSGAGNRRILSTAGIVLAAVVLVAVSSRVATNDVMTSLAATGTFEATVHVPATSFCF